MVGLVQRCQEVTQGGFLHVGRGKVHPDVFLRRTDLLEPFAGQVRGHVRIVLSNGFDESGSVAFAQVVVDPEFQPSEEVRYDVDACHAGFDFTVKLKFFAGMSKKFARMEFSTLLVFLWVTFCAWPVNGR